MSGAEEIPESLSTLLSASTGDHGPTRFGRIYAPDAAWLARATPEAIIDPDIEVVDSHHHLWEMTGHLYLEPHYVEDLRSGHRVVATVYNECKSRYRPTGPDHLKPVGEVEFAAAIAESASRNASDLGICAGIVGYADLELGDAVEEVLVAQIEAGRGRFRGVRNSGAWDDDPSIGNSHTTDGPGLYTRPEFHEGLRRLSALDLSLDVMVFHPQLPEVTALARAVPEATIVVNHLGGPLGYGRYAGKPDEVHRDWRAGLAELARCPNVSIKLGGVMMRLAAYDYRNLPAPPTAANFAEYWRRHILTAIDLFGPDRAMFESNFPVDKMGIGFRSMWNGYKLLVADMSKADRMSLLGGTARRIYRLPG